jgi:hypothetical protein
LNASFQCLVDFLVSDKKMTTNLTDSPVYVMNHFSPASFRVMSLSFKSMINMCFCPNWVVEFFYFFICVFLQIWGRF